MAWKSWRKWAADGADIGSLFLPGRFAAAAERGAEKLRQAEADRKRKEAGKPTVGRPHRAQPGFQEEK